MTALTITSSTRIPPCGCPVAWGAPDREAGRKIHNCRITAERWIGVLVDHDYKGTRFLSVDWRRTDR